MTDFITPKMAVSVAFRIQKAGLVGLLNFLQTKMREMRLKITNLCDPKAD